MKRQVDVIAALRAVNPVPPGRDFGVDHRSLEEALGSERSDVMSSTTITTRDGAEKVAPRWPKYLGAAAVAVVLIGLAVVLNRSQRSEVAWGDTPGEQQVAIERVVRAINDRDREAFVETFAPGGSFTPWVDFVDFPSPHPVTDSEIVETWMDVNEVWGLEARLHSCAVQDPTEVRCRATIHYDKMRLDLVEEWLFVFGDSGLNTVGMLEVPTAEWEFPLQWEAWLADNDPDLLARLGGGMSAPVSGSRPQTVNGIEYETQPFSYDPALADEIQASIDEYRATR